MAMVIKMVVITLLMNIFLYLGMNMFYGLEDSDGNAYLLNDQLKFHFNDDLLSEIMGSGQMDKIVNNTNEGFTTYDVNLTGDLFKSPEKISGGIGGLTSFIDVVDTTWSFIKMLFNIALAPLTLFFSYNLPVLIGLMIGIPYMVMFILGVIFFIRGMPS